MNIKKHRGTIILIIATSVCFTLVVGAFQNQGKLYEINNKCNKLKKRLPILLQINRRINFFLISAGKHDHLMEKILSEGFGLINLCEQLKNYYSNTTIFGTDSSKKFIVSIWNKENLNQLYQEFKKNCPSTLLAMFQKHQLLLKHIKQHISVPIKSLADTTCLEMLGESMQTSFFQHLNKALTLEESMEVLDRINNALKKYECKINRGGKLCSYL